MKNHNLRKGWDVTQPNRQTGERPVEMYRPLGKDGDKLADSRGGTTLGTQTGEGEDHC